MKSVIVTIIMFIAIYIMLVTGIFDFLAQKSVTMFALGAIAIMFIVAIIVLGFPLFKKKGKTDDE